MSRPSHKALMREALELTERNLGSMIAARFEATTVKAGAFVETMTAWRDVVRRALGHVVETPECICPNCGIRHGRASSDSPQF